ncbi:MAG: hypothetical protein SOW41_00405 [Anaerococcus sp.]|nr:hypothetical protein [Peptoniphilaceae bacterium]MDY3054501.1 hypothetical protein [Anaerococcus sp.]
MKEKNKEQKLEDVRLSMLLSRYTFLRYMTSIEFFIYLYWLISSLLSSNSWQAVFPFCLAFMMILINKEIFLLIKNNKKASTKKLVKMLKISMIILSISIVLTLTNYKLLFPYLNSKLFAITYLLLSMLIIVLSLHNATKIMENKDRVYKKYEEYKNKIKNINIERIEYV